MLYLPIKWIVNAVRCAADPSRVRRDPQMEASATRPSRG